MNYRLVFGAAVGSLLMLAPWSAQAFECPAHIAKAQEAVDRVSKLIVGYHSQRPLLASSQLREARMNLFEARWHHAKSGRLHHARAIVKANEALGYAQGAYMVSRNRQTSRTPR
jgi:hypothetical protein